MLATTHTKVVHGFYRYTDIWFEWNQVLPNQADGYAVKAILAHDAIVHPDHPLRIAGKPGIELSIGTLENGEARLLFSSAQVEYIRYWLHAMGLTKELIPLPYSDCLLTSSRLQNHSPVIYKTGSELRSALKMIDKNNRKLKGSDSGLNARRLMFERVRSLWSEQRGVWCAVDFEAWDMDHHVITEFGWSSVRWIEGEPVEDMGHLIVAKHRGYTNHFVPENKRFYHFGQSEDVTMKELKERIHTMIQSMAVPGPLFLVFHDNNQDLKYLRSPEIDAPLDGLSFFLPESCSEAETSDTPKLYVVDTSELFAALEGDSGGQKRSLERVCRLLQIKSTLTEHLHNAGNDARCTYLVLKELAGGDPLDMQRVTRWPRHTSNNSGLRVRFSKEDEDSDALPSDDDDDELITAGPYDPKTGKLRDGWAERIARLRQRLDGANGEGDSDSSKADGPPSEN
ncbi:hypothetical protein F5148DRAFT_1191684 [Russula earlei]|uniref:Uncharacterized protein n=1 Tax=Russula earlei TaxID=71964 RepID=A0ACC0UCH5_9AGAM|nr:hypothetical protein F5148DRAFT_1191684 [Russula earlei]